MVVFLPSERADIPSAQNMLARRQVMADFTPTRAMPVKASPVFVLRSGAAMPSADYIPARTHYNTAEGGVVWKAGDSQVESDDFSSFSLPQNSAPQRHVQRNDPKGKQPVHFVRGSTGKYSFFEEFDVMQRRLSDQGPHMNTVLAHTLGKPNADIFPQRIKPQKATVSAAPPLMVTRPRNPLVELSAALNRKR